MSDRIIRVTDVETTGVSETDAVVELGWCDLVERGNAWSVGEPHAILVNPGRDIPPEASAVHHITNKDVAGAASFAEALPSLAEGAPVALAAHRAAFEQQFLREHGPWVCTWKCALRLAPSAPAHSNQVLRYWLRLDCDAQAAAPPHRAGPDAYVTAHLLARMLIKYPLEYLIEISAEPALLPKFTFGKHAMMPIAEVPQDYLEWMSSQSSMDPDALYTARHELQRREAEGVAS